MSRPVGTRDKPEIFDRIINLLRKNPDGLNAYQIATRLNENDRTVRINYLPILIERGKVRSVPGKGKITIYMFNDLWKCAKCGEIDIKPHEHQI